MKGLDVMVAEVVEETHDTTTLTLFTGNDRLDYRAGHFVTIDPRQLAGLRRWTLYLEHVKGKKEKPRAYSLASAPCERHLAITVKEESYEPGVTPYPPLLSPILARGTPVGTMLKIIGFTGPYVMPEQAGARAVHVCAGSGIVPSFSILKQDLLTGVDRHHTLVYTNKTKVDVIFWQQLCDLEERFADRLTVVHTLTREGDDFGYSDRVRRGRVSQDLLAEVLREDEPLVFVCGPANTAHDKRRARQTGEVLSPKFFESVQGFLAELGVPKQRIIKESYG
jgi:ferredoxin-NADP reductase